MSDEDPEFFVLDPITKTITINSSPLEDYISYDNETREKLIYISSSG